MTEEAEKKQKQQGEEARGEERERERRERKVKRGREVEREVRRGREVRKEGERCAKGENVPLPPPPYLTLAAPSNPPTAYTKPLRTATPHRQRRIVSSGPSTQVWFFTSNTSVLLIALGAWPPTINMYWGPPIRVLERTGLLWLPPTTLSAGGVR